MKRILLILILINYTIAYSQCFDTQGFNVRGPSRVQYGLKECGIVFLSKRRYLWHFENLNLCDNYKKFFYLKNIPIDSVDLLSLNLRRKDLNEDSCLFVQTGECDSNAMVSYYVETSIPVCIDGVEYNYQDTIPAEYLNGDKLYFRRERRFFRKDKIIVEKEHK